MGVEGPHSQFCIERERESSGCKTHLFIIIHKIMRALSCVLHPKKKRFARVCKLGVFVALILYNFIFSVTKQEKERLWTYPAAILAESSTLALAFPSA